MPLFDPVLMAQIRQLIAQDLRAARSDEDLIRRLKLKGYGMRITDHGRVLTSLPHDLEIGPLN